VLKNLAGTCPGIRVVGVACVLSEPGGWEGEHAVGCLALVASLWLTQHTM